MNPEGYSAVKTLQVSRSRLLTKLQENLEAHKVDYREAYEGYLALQEAAIADVAAAANAFEDAQDRGEALRRLQESYSKFNTLDVPVDHSGDYEQAIEVMGWEERETVELSINDFECYVRDNWSWSRRFQNTVTSYKRGR